MMVRRYVVKDMPEAVLLIRKDLGKDAVILSTKKITVKKWMGLLRSKRIEVLASTGDDIPMRANIPQFQATPPRYNHTSAGIDKDNVQPMAESNQLGLARTPASGGSVHGHTAMHPFDGGRGSAVTPTLGANLESAVSARPDVESGLAPTTTGPAHEPVNMPELSEVWKELSEMRKLLETTMRDRTVVSQNQRVRHLVAQGVAEEDAVEWVEAAESRLTVRASSTASVDEEDVVACLRAVIEEQFGAFLAPSPIKQSTEVIAFVGPTGVGKTTTVAKVAALHVLGGQRQVGLVTTDTFRIAAVEQLRTYASILNVPLEVVYQPSDLPVALDRLSSCDLILIDTAGRNFLMDAYLEELNGMFGAAHIDETYLVLSLTSKLEDLNRVAQSFQSLPVTKFLFTKLDETTSIGSVLSLLKMHRLPLTYMTTGQNVPDDIELASLARVLNIVLGEES